ncbi:hypothetical protein V6N11_069554 [Hibiscus sabdariffa]|uniref:glucan endo-1,3-beta-D-glucosidase n=1 Tax=Hibiscus sabdariffa TaxID=183260 RepID=A0ABR2Q337_9ROSI
MVNSLGINYGQIADNLPPLENVVPLVKSIGATKVKLYDADPRVLSSFANTGVEFIIGLGNGDLANMRDPNNALEWVKDNVQSHLRDTKITCIFVGNEVLPPTMQSVHAALVNLGLNKHVTVTKNRREKCNEMVEFEREFCRKHTTLVCRHAAVESNRGVKRMPSL